MTDSKEPDHIGEVIAEDVAKRSQPLLTLAEALRQFRHNNSDEFVSGYDYDLTRKAFNELRQQLADVSNERDADRLEIDACGQMARMIEEREWAEHLGVGEVSSAVESAFTQMHNELSEARELSDALQIRLNASEARNAELEKVAQRYKWLSKTTAYQFKKIQDASVTDGGDELYFHADRFDAPVDSALAQSAPATDEQGARS